MDGRGEVLLPSGEASRIGVDLHVGMRIEFELKDGCARDPCTLEAGMRRLAVSS
jgi:hypothetical protein